MIVSRMIRAARLQPSVFNELERDLNATSQALVVVMIVALAQGFGKLLQSVYAGGFRDSLGGLFTGTIAAVVGWIIWSFVTYYVGTRVFGGSATPGQLLRCLGFAYTPGLLGVLVFIPCFGGIAGLIGGLWTLAAGVVAVREALDFDTKKAVKTTIVGWLLLMAVMLVFFILISPFRG